MECNEDLDLSWELGGSSFEAYLYSEQHTAGVNILYVILFYDAARVVNLLDLETLVTNWCSKNFVTY
jgi:hypothetical protein